RAGPAVAPAAQRLAAGYDNLADFRDVARLERAHLVGLRERSAEVVYVPYLAHDIHDFDALREIGALLDGRRA
ncbi:MAG: ArsA family ATPase, partial [Actinomycetota bacterium]